MADYVIIRMRSWKAAGMAAKDISVSIKGNYRSINRCNITFNRINIISLNHALMPAAAILPKSEHALIYLSVAEMKDPYKTIGELCDEYSLGTTREKIEQITEIANINDDIFDNSADRAELFYFKKLLQKALEALYIINGLRSKTPLEE